MILVDSSAWIALDRADESPADVALTNLVRWHPELIAATEPVLMEVLAGARSEEKAERLRHVMTSFGWFPCDPAADFEGAAKLYRMCRAAGITPRGTTDCLIAVVALRLDAEVLAADRDFEQIARVVPLRLHAA